MWNWKTFVIIFKFVRSLKKVKNAAHHLQNAKNQTDGNRRNSEGHSRFDLRHHPKVAPLVIRPPKDRNVPQPSPFIHQSITRQLAFGFKETKDVEAQATTPTRTFRADFYNGGWGNFVAKIITVAVLFVVSLFIIMILTRKTSY